MRSLYNFIFAAFIPLLLIGCNKDDSSDYIVKDTDKLNLSYAAVPEQFTVRVNGNWEAQADVNWVTLDPVRGSGNGRTYEYVTVTPLHNTGDRRDGVITITSAGKTTSLAIVQEDGHFAFGKPTLTGALKADVEASQVFLTVPYVKSGGTEIVSATVTISGDVSGIQVAPVTDVQLTVGDHNLSLPITGTPNAVGEVTFTVNAKVNGAAVDPIEVTFSVISENIILAQYFDLMAWGGDCVGNKSGTKPAATDKPNQPEDTFSSCSAGTDGTGNYFTAGNYDNWVSEKAGNPRGLAGWDGWAVYERPGYVKLGTGSYSGYICTPPLDLSAFGGQSDIFVTFDFSTYYQDTETTQNIGLLRGHVRDQAKGTFTTAATVGPTERKWVSYTIKITGARTGDRVCWGDYAGCVNENGKGVNNSSGNQRFCIDNIEVLGPNIPKLDAPLTAPENLKSTASAFSSLTLEWDPVDNATGYAYEIALVSNPGFSSTGDTSSNSIEVGSLISATAYSFKVQALYSLDESFNSPWTDAITASTMGALTPPTEITVPTATLFDNYATVTWNADPAAASYMVKVTNSGNPADTQTVPATSNEVTVTGLTASSSYNVSVMSIHPDGNEYNSPWSNDVAFTTIAQRTPFDAPANLKTHRTGSHELVFEWDNLNGQSGAQSMRWEMELATTPDGTPFRSFTMTPDAGNYNKYQFNRFIFSNLEPSTTYYFRVRRKPLDTETATMKESEWARIPVTTAAAPVVPANAILFEDFSKMGYGGGHIDTAFGATKQAYTTDATITAPYYTFRTPNNEAGNINNAPAGYRTLLGLDGWAFHTAYEFSGTVKMSTSTGAGTITTPALNGLTTTPTDIELSYKACPWLELNGSWNADPLYGTEDNASVKIIVTGSGTIDGLGAATEVVIPLTQGQKLQMQTYTVKILGATNDTKIEIRAAAAAGNRFIIDDILIVKK